MSNDAPAENIDNSEAKSQQTCLFFYRPTADNPLPFNARLIWSILAHADFANKPMAKTQIARAAKMDAEHCRGVTTALTKLGAVGLVRKEGRGYLACKPPENWYWPREGNDSKHWSGELAFWKVELKSENRLDDLLLAMLRFYSVRQSEKGFAKMISCGRNTVGRALKRLEAAGFITRQDLETCEYGTPQCFNIEFREAESPKSIQPAPQPQPIPKTTEPGRAKLVEEDEMLKGDGVHYVNMMTSRCIPEGLQKEIIPIARKLGFDRFLALQGASDLTLARNKKSGEAKVDHCGYILRSLLTRRLEIERKEFDRMMVEPDREVVFYNPDLSFQKGGYRVGA